MAAGAVQFHTRDRQHHEHADYSSDDVLGEQQHHHTQTTPTTQLFGNGLQLNALSPSPAIVAAEDENGIFIVDNQVDYFDRDDINIRWQQLETALRQFSTQVLPRLWTAFATADRSGSERVSCADLRWCVMYSPTFLRCFGVEIKDDNVEQSDNNDRTNLLRESCFASRSLPTTESSSWDVEKTLENLRCLCNRYVSKALANVANAFAVNTPPLMLQSEANELTRRMMLAKITEIERETIRLSRTRKSPTLDFTYFVRTFATFIPNCLPQYAGVVETIFGDSSDKRDDYSAKVSDNKAAQMYATVTERLVRDEVVGTSLTELELDPIGRMSWPKTFVRGTALPIPRFKEVLNFNTETNTVASKEPQNKQKEIIDKSPLLLEYHRLEARLKKYNDSKLLEGGCQI
eukprot:Lankesteria_metandrocarpae@DN6066_c0_g1_i1.p1